MASLAPRTVWLDVEGTSKTGDPYNWEECVANKLLPPLGRSYKYNFPLFDALESATVMVFTAYDAAGASHNIGVLRCELLDWIVAAHPRISVIGVATIIDPAFGHGPGAYFGSVIKPCERLLLRKCSLGGSQDVTNLRADDVVETLSPEDWSSILPMMYREILDKEQAMVERHLNMHAGSQKGSRPSGPMMDKERLARYCLLQGEDAASVTGVRVLFLDDNRSYIKMVERACADLCADLLSVHVTAEMLDAEAFLAMMEPKRSHHHGCVMT